MRLGAHVRRGTEATRGVVKECRDRGADCAQVFLSNPRGWRGPHVEPRDAAAFAKAWRESGLGPLVVHAPYLVNIASPDPTMLAKSRVLVAETVRACEALGVDLLVLHSGAGGPGDPAAARARAAGFLREAAAGAAHVRIVVELMAGTFGAVASSIPEAGALLDAAGDGRIGLCLDVCHLFAAGYGIDTVGGMQELFAQLHAHGLAGRLALIHANDSAYPRGERRDRHANIGEGFVGLVGWRALLARPELAELPFILETPGDAAQHARDLALLRALAPAPEERPA